MKLALTVMAAIAAVSTLVVVSVNAEVVIKYKNGYRHNNGVAVVVKPNVYVAPRVYRNDCVVTKKVKNNGNVVKKKYC